MMASPKSQESLNQSPTITSDSNQSSVNFKSQKLNDSNSSILANTELINLREKPQESIETFQSIVNALFGDAGDVSSDKENAFEDSEEDKSLKEKPSFSRSDNEEVECDEIPKLVINNIVPDTDDESNKTEEDEETNAAIINFRVTLHYLTYFSSESISGYNDDVRTHDSDDEDAISLAAIKIKYKTKSIDRFPQAPSTQSNDDEYDFEETLAKKYSKNIIFHDSDSEEDTINDSQAKSDDKITEENSNSN